MKLSNKNEKDWSHWHDRLHKKLLSNKTLLPKHSALLISLSGGQDSMAMVKLIIDLGRIYSWKLHIWHGNHGWHKKSCQIAKELESWCTDRNLSFYTNATTKTKTKTELSAREWRYQNLIQTVEEISTTETGTKCRHILTGHTSSDKAETFIMNLARGAHLKGLSSLKETRLLNQKIQLVRPILIFSRSETLKICQDLKIPVWVDPSNESNIFSRNRIRNEILPVLEDLHPGCTQRISNLSEKFNSYKEDQASIAILALSAISKEKGLCKLTMASIPVTARETILSAWLNQHGIFFLAAKQLNIISLKIIGNSPGSIDLTKGWKISWCRRYINLKQTSP